MTRWRLAFVTPRYGDDILGGAETFARCLAEKAISHLADVEVFTTCAQDHLTWRNQLPPGPSVINGVRIQRFPVDHTVRNVTHYERLHLRLIQRQALTLDEQYEWVQHGVHSPALYAQLRARHTEFDFIVFVPYLFGITYYGSTLAPEHTVLWPCLHDESYAYLAPTHDLFRTCRGLMFNTLSEQRLAQRLYGKHPGEYIVGFGLETQSGDPERFRATHHIHDPFMLYSGRLEGGKNVPLLVSYFIEYKRRNGGSLKLVLMGQGPEAIPNRSDIVLLGFQKGQAKLDAYAATTLLCQPSVNESFSIVIMEAWLSATPVLVHANCAVTREHMMMSNGGLYFRNYEEFEAILNLLTTDKKLARQLGENGLAYVTSNYNWDVVLRRFDAALHHWRALSTQNACH